MEPKDKVPTLEQCQKLVELGVVLDIEKSWFVYGKNKILLNSDSTVFTKRKRYPAPDVAELGELLGKYTVMKYCSDHCYRIYDEKGLLLNWLPGPEITEAQARCAALIWLIENKHFKLKEDN